MRLIKEIKSKSGVIHFKRWVLFQSKIFSIYIHGIYKEDNDIHLHNHPWNLLTIVLSGSYIELLENDEIKFRGFLNIGYRNRTKYHKIYQLLTKNVYTLAFVFGNRDEKWGYLVDNKHVEHTEYRDNKNKKLV
jgi:hypothetical protein